MKIGVWLTGSMLGILNHNEKAGTHKHTLAAAHWIWKKVNTFSRMHFLQNIHMATQLSAFIALRRAMNVCVCVCVLQQVCVWQCVATVADAARSQPNDGDDS